MELKNIRKDKGKQSVASSLPYPLQCLISTGTQITLEGKRLCMGKSQEEAGHHRGRAAVSRRYSGKSCYAMPGHKEVPVVSQSVHKTLLNQLLLLTSNIIILSHLSEKQLYTRSWYIFFTFRILLNRRMCKCFSSSPSSPSQRLSQIRRRKKPHSR
ncbi:uncharacterized protein RBU57_007266 [Macrochelys suwanniensis]